jgi:hypothetical protein
MKYRIKVESYMIVDEPTKEDARMTLLKLQDELDNKIRFRVNVGVGKYLELSDELLDNAEVVDVEVEGEDIN